MELFLQLGFGMMGLSKDLISMWGGGTVILSPRDLEPIQIEKIGAELLSLNGKNLVDPQFYLPRSDHHRLTSYNYWPQNYDTQGFDDSNREKMLEALVALNYKIGTCEVIVPGERAEEVEDLWLDSQVALLKAAQNTTDIPLIATICLSSEAVRSNEQINSVIQLAESQSVYGYYLVLEHPGNTYLVNDPQWMANSLDLAAGLRRIGAKVIIGYSNQQQLIMACAGVTAIASGTWMNVRSFFPGKFRSSYEEEIKRRAIWYYCPQALSEYTLPYLDISARLGLLAELMPDPASVYAEQLFSSPQPSASGWSESLAFRHYLSTLHAQVSRSTPNEFDETVIYHKGFLDRAQGLLQYLRENEIKGLTRDFYEAVDANRAALITLERTHGPLLKRHWNE